MATKEKKNSTSEGPLKCGSSKDKVISKKAKTKKKKKKSSVSKLAINRKDLFLQLLNEVKFADLDSACKCGKSMTPNLPAKCEYCLRLEADPTIGLPKRIAIKHCRSCGIYSHEGQTDCRALPQSTELLDFLIKVLKPYLLRLRLVMLDAQFLHTMALSKHINISLSLQMTTPTGELVKKSHTVAYRVTCQPCSSCLPMGPPSQWSSVVQLRPYVASKGSLADVEFLLQNYRAASPFLIFKRVGQGIDVFFPGERNAKDYIACISRLAPIKQDKIHKKILSGNPRSTTVKYQSCIPALFCSICCNDLIFLPSKVSIKLGNIGPLVICTSVTDYITFLDPFKLTSCTLRSDAYWNAPFESLKTRRELVELIVLNVEVVSKGKNYSLANAEVARISDFGKNDLIFSVKTHLGQILKPGDHALGYVLYGENISNVEAEKCRGLLPDVVLIRKKYDVSQWQRRVRRTLEKKDASPEYLEFLKNLEKNPEAMFNLSLNCGNEDEKRTSIMAIAGTGKNVDFNLEDSLADLDLNYEEGGDSTQKE